MASYPKGEQTRAALLDAARKLFYEKGYAATRLDDIAVQAGANHGLIHYYFKTKANIALEIYGQILDRAQSEVSRVFPDAGVLLRRVLEIRMLWDAIAMDASFASFMSDISAKDIPILMGKDIWGSYMDDINNAAKSGYSAEKLNLISRCGTVVESELIRTFIEQPESFSIEDLSSIDISSFLSFFSIGENEVRRLINEAGLMVGSVSVSVNDRMVISLN